ncbi:hypothetical protein ACAG24_026115 [Mycobacterium sp. pW049]|uniref:hypothetical protein n=1 Tax=[Mycobacterium] bulgaricum TaxID=3238985 RepID=UPI00351BC197
MFATAAEFTLHLPDLRGMAPDGMATPRYALEVPAARSLGHDELARWARPLIRRLLVGPPQE